jgi:hypothetical protein
VGVVVCGFMIAVAMEDDVVSRYVVEKGSDFGVGFRRVVLSSGEVIYRCLMCPCVFSSFLDLELHLNAFGRVGSFHREAWRLELLRRGVEWGELVRAGRGFRRSKGSWFSEHG